MTRASHSLLCVFAAACLTPTPTQEPEAAPAHEVASLEVTILSTMLTEQGIGEWGFAALVEADGHRILFDTGSRPDTVLQNARELGVDLSDVEEVVLSHNHGDHTGGLVALRREMKQNGLEAISRAHVGRGIFWERPNYGWETMAAKREAFEELGGTVIEHAAAVQIHPGIWLTGPVPRPNPERNYGNPFNPDAPGGRVQSPDGLIEDNIPESMSMVINTPKGLVVISGCGHAGMINTLEHAQSVVGPADVYAAIGGFHLLHGSDEHLEWTAMKLRDLGLQNLVGAHCTGLEPVYRLRELLSLGRSHAVVGATGGIFSLENGIEPGALAR